MSTVRPDFAELVHKVILADLEDALKLTLTNCQQPSTQPGQATPPPPQPPKPPVPPQPPSQPVNTHPNNPLDDIKQQAHDAEEDFYKALNHCDVVGMKLALSKLGDLAQQARRLARAARTAGPYGALNPKDAEDVEAEIRDFIDKASHFTPRCELPQPKPAVSCPPASPPPAKSTSMSASDQRMLALHNAERSAVGAPPLRWDATLAEHAQAYAMVLASTGELVHAPRAGRGIERENLVKGSFGWSPERLVGVWAAERTNFTAGVFPNVSRTGNWSDVAHYSQMIWPTTTDVGCGSATGQGFTWLVCRYSPGGNRDGQAVGMPAPPCTPALQPNSPTAEPTGSRARGVG